jgi:hypothetical protein
MDFIVRSGDSPERVNALEPCADEVPTDEILAHQPPLWFLAEAVRHSSAAKKKRRRRSSPLASSYGWQLTTLQSTTSD